MRHLRPKAHLHSRLLWPQLRDCNTNRNRNRNANTNTNMKTQIQIPTQKRRTNFINRIVYKYKYCNISNTNTANIKNTITAISKIQQLKIERN